MKHKAYKQNKRNSNKKHKTHYRHSKRKTSYGGGKGKQKLTKRDQSNIVFVSFRLISMDKANELYKKDM